jgi:predicted Zn-dependent peptidase
MTRIGKSELNADPLLSLGELLDRIEAVSLADVAEIAEQVLSQAPTLAVIGPFDGPQRFRS